MNRFRWTMLTAAVLAASACSEGGTQAVKDAVTTDAADPGADLDAATGDAPGDADSTDGRDPGDAPDANDVPYQDGAHASVTTSADQLIGGPQAAGVVGDVLLYNHYVRFVVRNQARSLFSPYGGALVDADVVRAEGEPGHDKFFEVFPMIGFGRVFKPTGMQIVDDGTHSGTAVVRFTGTDGGMTIIDSLLPTAPMYMDVTVDYILGPDARYVEVATTVRNAYNWTDPIDLGQILQFGKRLEKFHDHCGPDQDCLSSRSDVRWLGAQAGDVSYGFTVPGGQSLTMLLAVNELMLLKASTVTLADGESTTFRQFLAAGHGSVDEVVPSMQGIRAESIGAEVEVNVSLADGLSSLADVRVRAKRTDDVETAYASAAIPNASGTATLHLAPGTYDIEVSLPGSDDAIVPAVTVTEDGPNVVAATANPAGWMRVKVKNGEGAPVTAGLTLQAGAGAQWTQSVVHFEAIRDGDYRFPVLAGTYTATVAKGMVWTVDRQDVTVAAGSETLLDATIQPALDTTGYMMVNTHEHCERSIDSFVLTENRIYNALANGIDVMNPSDHDRFGTHQPMIEKLGLKDQVISFWGCEVSPLWGHTTAIGCSNPPAYEQYYSIDFLEYDQDGGVVRNLTPSEIYAQARNVTGCRFLAVNHPYRGEATFLSYGVDERTNPTSKEPDLDLHLVDAMEVYNKSDDISTILDQNLPAWFNLLNRGYHIAALGGSDEHGYNGNYGNPRNMVPVSATSPRDVDQVEMFDHMKAFRHQVVGGPILWITVNGASMGDTVATDDSPVQVHVKVEAPEWMPLGFVKLYVNGEVVQDLVPPATTDAVRLDQTFDLPLTVDSHIVLAAGSTVDGHQMTPVSPKLPFSVTNPVFVDVGGNGYKAIYEQGAPWDTE